MTTSEKQLGYAKGYAAGKRLAVREVDREQVEFAREDFIQRMMISIAPQVIAAPWGREIDGKFAQDRGAPKIMKTVRSIAEEAAKTCAFLPPQRLGGDLS